MQRRAPLRHALAFTAGLVALLGGLSATLRWGARHATAGDAGKISQVVAHRIDVDLAVFGASNAETGISPAVLERETGKSAYNLALDGTGIEQFGALVRELSRYARPNATVILAVSAFALMNHDLPTSPSRYYPHLDNALIYESMAAFDPALTWRIRYVPFYDFVAYDHGYYKTAVEGLVGATRGSRLPDDKGFTPQKMAWVERAGGATKKFDCTVDSRIVAMYRSVIAELESAGREVIIVFPPIQSEAPKGLAGLEVVGQAFASIAGTKHPYLDYRFHEMGREKRYFYNYTHLNAEGAEVFSTILGRDLAKILGSPRP